MCSGARADDQFNLGLSTNRWPRGRDPSVQRTCPRVVDRWTHRKFPLSAGPSAVKIDHSRTFDRPDCTTGIGEEWFRRSAGRARKALTGPLRQYVGQGGDRPGLLTSTRLEAPLIADGLIAFPITPMDAAGCVDSETLRRLVRRLVEAEVDAVCVLGSTGSYPFLAREERRRAIEAAAAEADGGLPLLAGVGALRTDHAILHAQDAAAAGAARGLLAPMSYTPLTDEEVDTHFAAVAQAAGLPLCIYDNPASTHFAISDTLIERLSRIPNVVALKSPSPSGPEARDRVQALRSRTPDGFSVGFSGDANAAEAMIAGGDAWYSVLGGLFPAPVVAIRRAVAAGDIEAARRLDRALRPMWELFREFSGLRVVYAAARLTGLCEADPPRPILPLAPAARARVAAVIEELSQVLGGYA